jgi:hypothetical protein
MLIKDMTDKTKEVHAESLLKISSTFFTAIFVTILLAPLTIVMQGNAISLMNIWENLGWEFGVLLGCCILFASWFQEGALKTYNELYPNKK